MTMRLCLSLAAAIVAGVSAIAAQPYSSISLGIGADEYFGTVYTAPPIDEVPFMLYIGERIRFRVDLVNGGDTTQTLSLKARGASQLCDAEITKGNVAVPVRLRIDRTVEREDASGRTPVNLGGSVTLPTRGKLSIRGDVESIPPEPGVYVIDISTDLADAAGRPLAPQSTRLSFELRQPTGGEGAEIARRSALRALADGNLAQSEGFVSRLLALNPTSVAAFTIRAQIAQAQGQKSDALTLYRRALEILEGNRDQQYLLRIGWLVRDEQIDGLRRVIRGLGGH
jgi:hypothetical protein